MKVLPVNHALNTTKSLQKRYVLSLHLKENTVVADLSSCGREFQRVGP